MKTGDGDISDGGDDIVWDEDFNAPPGEDDDSKVEVSHDHAGNLIDDGDFRYVYAAWPMCRNLRNSIRAA